MKFNQELNLEAVRLAAMRARIDGVVPSEARILWESEWNDELDGILDRTDGSFRDEFENRISELIQEIVRATQSYRSLLRGHDPKASLSILQRLLDSEDFFCEKQKEEESLAEYMALCSELRAVKEQLTLKLGVFPAENLEPLFRKELSKVIESLTRAREEHFFGKRNAL